MASAPWALLKTPIVSTETSPDRRPVSPAVSFARQARYRIADERSSGRAFLSEMGRIRQQPVPFRSIEVTAMVAAASEGGQSGGWGSEKIATQHVMAGLVGHPRLSSDVAVQRRRSPEQVREDAGNWSAPMNRRRSSSQPTPSWPQDAGGLPRGSGGGASSHPIPAAHRSRRAITRGSPRLTPPLPIRSSPVRSCGLWCRHWQSGATTLLRS